MRTLPLRARTVLATLLCVVWWLGVVPADHGDGHAARAADAAAAELVGQADPSPDEHDAEPEQADPSHGPAAAHLARGTVVGGPTRSALSTRAIACPAPPELPAVHGACAGRHGARAPPHAVI